MAAFAARLLPAVLQRALWASVAVANATSAPSSSAGGNTYKNMYEQTSMNSGLSIVVLVNLVVAWLGVLLYRYVILREAGLLSPDEVALLRKYPAVRVEHHSYTPSDAYVRAPPPMRWTGWPAFFTASDHALSRDAQVYLLFQRACILTTAICALFATVVLLPSYWFGGAVFHTDADNAPTSLLNLLRTDRGLFERLTSHNLPPDSPLVMLQLPVFVVTAACVVVLYTVVKAAAGEERSVADWLQDGSCTPALTPAATPTSTTDSLVVSAGKPSPTQLSRCPQHHHHRYHHKIRSYWTLFARGLPRDVRNADEVVELLDAIYPGQVLNVELVCKGRTSEARLLRALSSARNRLDYLYETAMESHFDHTTPTFFGRIFGLFAPRHTRAQLTRDLERKIVQLRTELDTRKSEPVREFLGCGFISFRSAAAAGSLLRDFPVRFHADSANYVLLQAHSDQHVVIHRHPCVTSTWGMPYLRNLYRATINLFPQSVRVRLMSSSASSSSAPAPAARDRSDSQAASLSQEQLDHGMPPERSPISAQTAISRLRKMKAERAPKSGDIIWNNIGLSFFERTVREMIVQVVVFAILILFTSPVAMLTALKLIFAEISLLSDSAILFANGAHGNFTLPHQNPFNETTGFAFVNFSADDGNAAQAISEDFLDLLPNFLTSNAFLRSALLNYLPVLTLAIIFAAVPSVLRLTCALEGYPTHSAQEMSVFRKTSFYYVMNALVLPSLALNTASEFLAMIYKQSNGGANVYNTLPILQRLFSGDIAFFLCTYLVQLALTGSVFWLMRIPSSFSMMVRRRMALTPLEAAEAKCTDIFDYPRHYAYSVTAMSMCLLFGFMAPLLWWFALLYFVCKHLVDLYTIRYVHPRSHIDGRLPRLSSKFILTWTTVSQFSLAAIFYLQGWVHAAVLTLFLCVLTLACCLSVNAHVGNRIMRFIADLRDRAIQKVMSIGGRGYDWMPSPSLVSSSSSSSTQSFAGSHESDALLAKPQSPRGLSVPCEYDRATWDEQGLTRLSAPNKIGTDPNLADNESQQIRLQQNHVVEELDHNDSCISDDEEEETDAEDIVLERDIESPPTRRVLEYGTCSTSGASGNAHNS